MHLFSPTFSRKSTPTPSLQTAIVGLLAATLVVVATGCGGAGANGGDDGNGDDEDPGTGVLAAPSGLNGESKDAAIDLTWEAVDADDLDGYNVYRSTSSIGEDVSGLDPRNGSPLAETSFTDNGAENGTTYHYVVTAVDTDGNESEPSSEIEKTPFDDPPNRPE
jgi:TolB protein